MGIAEIILVFISVLLVMSFISSIPSIISIIRDGKDYFRDIKLLYNLYKELDVCYKLNTIQTVTTEYFFPIYINDNHVFIVNVSDIVYYLRINDAKYNGEDWTLNLIVIDEYKTNICLFKQILIDRFQRKLDKLMKNYTTLEDIENLNQLINSEILSIKRDTKLNIIING